MMKAKVARPTGHQMTKPRIISAIQAGFPNSSSFAKIGMWASWSMRPAGLVVCRGQLASLFPEASGLGVNVNNIYIARIL